MQNAPPALGAGGAVSLPSGVEVVLVSTISYLGSCTDARIFSTVSQDREGRRQRREEEEVSHLDSGRQRAHVSGRVGASEATCDALT